MQPNHLVVFILFRNTISCIVWLSKLCSKQHISNGPQTNSSISKCIDGNVNERQPIQWTAYGNDEESNRICTAHEHTMTAAQVFDTNTSTMVNIHTHTRAHTPSSIIMHTFTALKACNVSLQCH